MKRSALSSIITVLCVLSLCSCKGTFKNGDVVTRERDIKKFFNCIQINDNISITLKESESDRQYVEVTSGEFVIDNLTTEVIGDTLVVRNTNRFDWLRSYNCPFEMTIYYTHLGIINYQGTGSVKSLDSIRGYETDTHTVTNINIMEGSGDIDITVSCNNAAIYYKHGTSKVIVRGKVFWSQISANGFGPIEAENLKSNEVYFNSTSTCYAKVWATDLLQANLDGLDYLYYRGNPEIVCNRPSKLIKIPE